MLPEEARWLAEQVRSLPASALSPLLEVGSGTSAFRREAQPHIERDLLAPARASGIEIVHSNLEPGEGIDLVGDLMDPAFLSELKRRQIRSVLCANVLEHVPDPRLVARSIVELLPPGGYLLVTVPRRYPHHPDPIDTMFRPTPAELAELFPGCRLVASGVVAGPTRLGEHGWRLALRQTARLALPFVRPRGWLWTLKHLRWLLIRPLQACVVLHKETAQSPRTATLHGLSAFQLP